jgi:sensor histidine kinase YesM
MKIPLRNLLIGFLIWTAYILFNSGILALQQNLYYLHALFYAGFNNYVFALLSIGIWYLCQNLPFNKSRLLQFFGIHLLVCLLFPALWLAIIYSVRYLTMYEKGFLRLLQEKVYLWEFLDGVTKYSLLVGIFYTINFYKKFKEKELKETELSLLTKNMELQNLKSQINPHFLFNALNSVNALMAKEPEKARTMNAKLAQLLRISLDGYDRKFVTLRQELDFIRNYLDIEKVRFGDKLTVVENIDPKFLDTKIPSMLLQPIVENAVKHGIAKKAGGGDLQLTVRDENGGMIIEILNGGKTARHPNPAEMLEKGIGLKNTNERLTRIYGEAFGLRITDQPAGKFTVRIKIPY